jgi:hypothetical protein
MLKNLFGSSVRWLVWLLLAGLALGLPILSFLLAANIPLPTAAAIAVFGSVGTAGRFGSPRRFRSIP